MRRISSVILKICVFGIFALNTPTLLASPIFDVASLTQEGSPPLGPYISIYTGPDISIESIQNLPESQWIQSTDPIPNFSFGKRNVWARIFVKNSLKTEESLLLESHSSVIDNVFFYDAKINRSVSAGRLLNFSEREVKHRHPVFRILIQPEETRTLYLRFQSRGPIQVPLVLWSETGFKEKTIKEYLLLGLYFGVMFALLIYNMILFFTVREESYLYYCLYVACTTTFYLFRTGLGDQFLFHDQQVLTSDVSRIFAALGIFAITAFCRSFMQTHKHAPLADKALMVVGLINIPVIGMLIFNYGWIASLITNLLVFLVGILGLGTAVYLTLKRQWRSRNFLLGWSGLLCAMIFEVLARFDVIPMVYLVNYAIQMGTAVELLFLSFALGQRINKLREEKTRIVEEKRLVEIEVNRERANALISGQEQERKRLSQELHDGVGQALSAILIGLENVEYSLKRAESEEGLKVISTLKSFARETIDEVREISHELVPSVLYNFGLEACVRQRLDMLQSTTKMTFRFKSNIEDARFADALEISVFRVVQEAVNNAVTHSEANQIQVRILQRNNHISALIMDNGIGFDKTKRNANNGLTFMRDRVSLLGGHFALRSAPKQGTAVWLKVPRDIDRISTEF